MGTGTRQRWRPVEQVHRTNRRCSEMTQQGPRARENMVAARAGGLVAQGAG